MRPKFTCAGSIPSPRNREKYICICKIKQTLGCVNSTQVARGTQDAGFTQPSLHLFLQVHMRRLPRTACYFSARARYKMDDDLPFSTSTHQPIHTFILQCITSRVHSHHTYSRYTDARHSMAKPRITSSPRRT